MINIDVLFDIKNGEGDIKFDYVSGEFLINNGKGNINFKIEKIGSFKVLIIKGNIVVKIDRISGYGMRFFLIVGGGNI